MLKTNGFINEQAEVPISWKTDGSNGPMNVGPGYMQPGDYKIVDANGDGHINSNDYVYIGSALPTISGGIVNEFKWKGFDVNMLLSYQLGRYILYPFAVQSLASNEFNALIFDLEETTFGKSLEIKPIMPDYSRDMLIIMCMIICWIEMLQK